MVHVKDFGKGAGFEFQAVCHQRALEIAHSALPFVHAAAQRMDSLGRKAIDAARHIREDALVVKADNAAAIPDAPAPATTTSIICHTLFSDLQTKVL